MQFANGAGRRSRLTSIHAPALLGLASVCLAAAPSERVLNPAPEARTLKTDVRSVRALSPELAGQKPPIHLRGVVTTLSGWKNSFFLQDATGGISVDRTEQTPELHPGDEIDLTGTAGPGLFAPVALSTRIRILATRPLPKARIVPAAQLFDGQQDSQRITLPGVVRSAEVKTIWDRPVLYLRVNSGSVEVPVHVLNFRPDFARLVDSYVLLHGVCGTNFNDLGQLVGVRLFVSDLNDISITRPAPSDPFFLPLRSIDSLLRFSQNPGTTSHRVRVRGLVTYQHRNPQSSAEMDNQLYLQDNGRALFVHSRQSVPLPLGTEVEVVGFATPGSFAPVLEEALIRPIFPSRGPSPLAIQADQVLAHKNGFETAPFAGLLVTLPGQLLELLPGTAEQTLVLSSGGSVFSARLPASKRFAELSPGVMLQLTGICTIEASATREPKSFQILLRSPSDIVVTRTSPWWNLTHTLWILALTVAATLLALAAIVTLRRRIQKQVRQIAAARDHYHGILDSANDAFIETDSTGRITEWNRRAEQLFGWSRSQALGRSFVETIAPPPLRPTYSAHLQNFYAYPESTSHQTIELAAMRRDSGELLVSLTLWTMQSRDHGASLRVNAFIRDITAQKDAEEKALADRRSLDLALREGQIATWHFDVAADSFSWGDHAHLLFGRSHSELPANTAEYFAIVHPDDLAQLQEIIAIAYQTGHYKSDCRILWPDGSARVLASCGEFVFVDSRPVQVNGIIWDITARKETEAALLEKKARLREALFNLQQSNEQLEARVAERTRALESANTELQAQTRAAQAANIAKTDFLAAMSHEIRTPMNAILGMADLLSDSHLDPTQRQYVEVFRRAGSNLLTLVNDLLDLSKIESGHFELEQIDFELEDVVDRTIELIRPKTKAKHLSLISRIAPGIPPTLTGDPTRLQQVLLNLLGNAVKFTERGEITFTVSPDLSSPGRFLFEVTDTGIGIADEKLETIFNDFTQAEPSTTRRYGGTGLGLGICRRLIQRMGGKLRVQSRLGFGSTFSFDAVFATGAPFKTRRSDTLHAGLTGRRVLVVDSNATNRLIFTEMCSGWGMIPSESASPGSALLSIEAAAGDGEPFDLLILDRLMPGMNGFEVVAALQEKSIRIPVILTTSDNVAGDHTRSRRMGIAGYAVKPIGRSELLRLICDALGVSEPPPALAGQAAHPEPPTLSPTTPSSPARTRILVAEDSDDNRFLIQAYLKDAPYELVFAENGQAAVDAFVAAPFELVLMDIQMPVLDGLAATRLIRQFELDHHLSPAVILALSANARAEDFNPSRAAGCDSHVSKPISKLKLLDTLKQFLPARPAPPTLPPGLEQAALRYLESRRNEVPVLQELLRNGEFDRLRTLAHNMKGAGTSFGFPDITRIGALLEQSAKNAEPDFLSRQLLELSRFVNQASESLACVKP